MFLILNIGITYKLQTNDQHFIVKLLGKKQYKKATLEQEVKPSEV